VNVSVPSVTRLTKRLGYPSFKDFKLELAVNEAQSSSIADVFSQITGSDTDAEIIDKVFLGNIKSLEDTQRIVDHGDIVSFAKQCAAANRILFFGEGSSGIVGKEAALRFSHIDIQAESYSDTVSIMLQALRLKKKQVCIGISHSGRTGIVEEGLRVASMNGATVALITNYMNAPLKKYCDYVFYTSFVEASVKSAALSSIIAQTAILEVIYLLTAKKKPNLGDLRELDILLERILRTR